MPRMFATKRLQIALFLGFALLPALFPLAAASAQDAEAEFFRGKTVRLTVGYGPGGGYDSYARMIAPYLSKELGASVVVENQPGAGGITALNNLAIAPADGLHMMLVNGTAAGLSQVLGAPGVRYDLEKMTQLGTVGASPWVWLVPKNSPLRTIEDARKAEKPINWAASGPIDGLSDGALVTCEALNLKCKIVMGYKGSSDAGLAVARGEMDSIYVSDTSANNYVKAGDLRALANTSRKKSRFFPDLPTIYESVKLSPEDEWLLDFHATMEDLGRILVMPGDVPPARLAFINAAVARAMKDPALIADGEKSQRYIDFIGPEATRQSVHQAIGGLTPEQKKRVLSVITTAR